MKNPNNPRSRQTLFFLNRLENGLYKCSSKATKEDVGEIVFAQEASLDEWIAEIVIMNVHPVIYVEGTLLPIQGWTNEADNDKIIASQMAILTNNGTIRV